MADPTRPASLPTCFDRLTRLAASRPSTREVVLGPAYLWPLTNSASIGKASPAAPCHGSSAAWTSATSPARAAGPAAPIGPDSGDPAHRRPPALGPTRTHHPGLPVQLHLSEPGPFDQAAQRLLVTQPDRRPHERTRRRPDVPIQRLDQDREPGLWSIDRELLFDHPDRAAHVRRWSKLRVWFFLDGKARCSVPREDCGPRREGAAAPPVGQGASSQEVAAAAAPSPLPGWTPARRSHHVAWHATLAASHRWRGGSPCQPSLVAAPHVWLPLS
jgi:hypothetical protein